jgi:orotidine-5'-phosphate decarboxylase
LDPRERLILALDVDNAFEAVRLARLLSGHVGAFKVGLELVNSTGLGVLDKLKDSGASRIFYDCKLHDIPNTVAGAMRAIGRMDLWMVNVHAAGGKRMIADAARALADSAGDAGLKPPILLGVTLLTSISEDELHDELHCRLSTTDYVESMARLVHASGGQGVVASPHEIEVVRAACGDDFLIVTPGVRPAGVAAGDQRRTMTPGEAVRLGADYLVVGRALTAAPDPVAAAEAIVAEVAAAA